MADVSFTFIFPFIKQWQSKRFLVVFVLNKNTSGGNIIPWRKKSFKTWIGCGNENDGMITGLWRRAIVLIQPISSHLLKKFLIESFIYCGVNTSQLTMKYCSISTLLLELSSRSRNALSRSEKINLKSILRQ